MDFPTNRDWIQNNAEAWLPIAKKITVLERDNPHNVAIMLAAFSEGAREVLTSIKTENFVPPPLVIDQSEAPRISLAGYEWEKSEGIINERIVLSGRHFLYESWFSTDEDLDIRHLDGIASYVGKRTDRYVLAGIEEMDHAHFQWTKGHEQLPESNQFLKQSSYDSCPLEFRSLQTRLRIAIEMQMDPRTIEVLQHRIEAAQRIIDSSKTS